MNCPTNPPSSTSTTQTMSTRPKPPCTWSHKPGRDHAGGLGGPDGSAGGHRHRGAAGCIPVCSGAAIQRLRLHRGLPGHEAGGLDYRSCQRLPVFRRWVTRILNAGQSQRPVWVKKLPDGNGAQQVLPGDGGALRHRHPPSPAPQPQVTKPLWRAPWAWSPPGSWQPCVTASSCPSQS